MNQHHQPSPVDIATTFFDHWNGGRIEDAIAMLDENVFYDNVPLPNIHGRQAVREFHQSFGVGSEYTVDWKVNLLAATGNVVLNERLDVFRHKSGKEIVLPVMGTLTIVDGSITVWRDYFDLASFEKQAAAISG